ncbi:MAG: ATP-binding protein [bacterium]|nr:ATP-binding protein [bacterium]
MWLFPLTAFVNAVISFFLGALVYLKNRGSRLNQSFVLFAFSVTVWSFSYSVWQIVTEPKSALFWARALMVGAIFIPICYFYFVISFLNIVNEKRKILVFGILLSFIFFLLNFTSLFVVRVVPKLNFSYWPEPGIAFHPFLAMFFTYAIYSWYLLIRAYYKSTGIRREQIKYVFIGTLIGFLGGSTNYFLWYDIPILPYGNILIIVYLISIAYAIIRYRLMDIRFVLGRGAVYLLSLVTVVGLAFFMMFLNGRFFSDLSFNVTGPVILIISILFFQPVFRFFEKFASRYFYYTFYSYQTVLTDLGRKLTRVLDLDRFSFLVVSTLINTMKLERTAILLREEKTGEYQIQTNIGFKEENGIALVNDEFLTKWMERTQKPLVYEELSLLIRDTRKDGEKGEERKKLEALRDDMKKMGAAFCLPLFMERKIIGLILLGNKISKDPYSEQDVGLLITLSNQVSISLQNALLYSETMKFGAKLEKEVAERTKELKEAYDDLKKLDKAKSEFISIASHQLRTPLTAIKGYISMMLENTYGTPPEKMEKPLKNIYISNERLLKLVNDLLNISRIESGRLEIKLEEASVEELIVSIVEELKNVAKEKGVYLKFEKPAKPISKISIDKDTIRQVIMNIIDNAIHYTSQGGVTIKVKSQKLKVQIKISDTGEGMTKEEISRLFESFARGEAGTRFWTEGMGLGLYVAKKFVDMHKGKIWAESKGKGKGSTFYIELPIR